MADTPTAPATRINAVESIERALHVLTSHGYATAALWAEHNHWLETVDLGPITEDDRHWATQLPEPSSIEQHVANGTFEVLSAARCHVGRHYTLSPGQREVIREIAEMTPTKEVIVTNVTLFPDEDVIRSFTIRSTEHIDPRRRHVAREVVITPAWKFFASAATKDKEREERNAAAEAARLGEPKAPKVPKAQSIGLSYLT